MVDRLTGGERQTFREIGEAIADAHHADELTRLRAENAAMREAAYNLASDALECVFRRLGDMQAMMAGDTRQREIDQ